jgi:hypothetical protein
MKRRTVTWAVGWTRQRVRSTTARGSQGTRPPPAGALEAGWRTAVPRTRRPVLPFPVVSGTHGRCGWRRRACETRRPRYRRRAYQGVCVSLGVCAGVWV